MFLDYFLSFLIELLVVKIYSNIKNPYKFRKMTSPKKQEDEIIIIKKKYFKIKQYYVVCSTQNNLKQQ